MRSRQPHYFVTGTEARLLGRRSIYDAGDRVPTSRLET
jgi:hypothetical protein